MLFRWLPALCDTRSNTCSVCQQGFVHMHQHMLPLIDKTPPEAALTFASCLRISEPISHHTVPPTCMSRQPYLSLSVPTQPLFPHFQLQSLPLLSAHTTTSTQTHKPLHLPLPTRRFSTLVLSAFPRSPILPSARAAISSDVSQGCGIFSSPWN